MNIATYVRRYVAQNIQVSKDFGYEVIEEAKKIKCRIDEKVLAASDFLKGKYIDFGQGVLNKRVAPVIAKFMRHMIVLQGKDPDTFVPDPFVRMSLPEQLAAAMDTLRPGRVFVGSHNCGWEKKSFKKPEKHPIFRIRRAKAEEAAEKTKSDPIGLTDKEMLSGLVDEIKDGAEPVDDCMEGQNADEVRPEMQKELDKLIELSKLSSEDLNKLIHQPDDGLEDLIKMGPGTPRELSNDSWTHTVADHALCKQVEDAIKSGEIIDGQVVPKSISDELLKGWIVPDDAPMLKETLKAQAKELQDLISKGAITHDEMSELFREGLNKSLADFWQKADRYASKEGKDCCFVVDPETKTTTLARKPKKAAKSTSRNRRSGPSKSGAKGSKK